MNSRLWIRPRADLVRRGKGRNQPPAHGLEAVAGSGLTERPRRVQSGHWRCHRITSNSKGYERNLMAGAHVQQGLVRAGRVLVP
jgi:hypothetical protein